MVEDPTREAIEGYLQTSGKTSVLPGEIAREALGVKSERIDTKTLRAISDVLFTLGWQKSEKMVNGYKPWIKHASRPFASSILPNQVQVVSGDSASTY